MCEMPFCHGRLNFKLIEIKTAVSLRLVQQLTGFGKYRDFFPRQLSLTLVHWESWNIFRLIRLKAEQSQMSCSSISSFSGQSLHSVESTFPIA